MAKKIEVSEEQLSFLEFLPVSADKALAQEVWVAEKKRSAPDSDPRLLKWRDDYLDWWCEMYPSGECARITRNIREERGD